MTIESTVIKSIRKLVRLVRFPIAVIAAAVIDNEAAYVVSTTLRTLEAGIEFWERRAEYKRRRDIDMLCFHKPVGRSTAPNSAKRDSAKRS